MLLSQRMLFKILKYKYLTLILVFIGCSSSRLSKFSSTIQQEPFNTSFHSWVVMDANSGKVLHNTNGDKYFIPASNVKIFTLFASKKMLPKKAPALQYYVTEDTTFIKGTGYPTTLHPYFKDSTVITFMEKQQNNSILEGNSIDKYGPGWAWEDYDTYFSPELNAFPLYGNVLSVYPENPPKVSPTIFVDSLYFEKNPVRREELSNQFYVQNLDRDTLNIPFITSHSLTQKLLKDVLNKKVGTAKKFPEGEKQALYGLETDSIVKRMMFVSDNFLAEQLLLMCSSTISDTLSTKKGISHILENELKDLKHPPRWVDGSGLSRYNLFTPESMTHVLKRLYDEVPQKELFALFPSWNRHGTQKTWKSTQRPKYIFAKSGAMGNTYNLSGYLKTKSGRVLIFSSMNNHFRIPTSAIRREIELTLESLWERY